MPYSNLEDFFGDIVGKARRGHGYTEKTLAKMSGLTESRLKQIEAYAWVPGEEEIHKLAGLLNLDGPKLVQIARGWMPPNDHDVFENNALRVERLVLDAGGMQVNGYLMACKRTGMGAVVDPGAQPEQILARVNRMGLRVSTLLITHGHGDHVGALAEVARSVGVRGCACGRDLGLMGSKSDWVGVAVEDGWETRVGDVNVAALSLPGHTPGGIGYAAGPVVFSGDALFAGSMGGARGPAYAGQIQAVRQKILTMPGTVHILPGHGPRTTVEEERAFNPFFT